MNLTWPVAARYLILLFITPFLMALECGEDGPTLVDDEESCNFGPNEAHCKVSISMRNASSEALPIHLWTTSANETIGPSNQLSAGAERCRTSLIFPGNTADVSVSAGRGGVGLDTENITFTVTENTVVNANWNGTTLSISTRPGTVPCVS
ncbi:MAG: hypothetical protein ABR559_09160 [Gemmatimonadota bacterium]